VLNCPESRSLGVLTTSLSTAFAIPALFLAPQALAQTSPSGVTQLAPVRVEGESPDSYTVPTAAQAKFTAPLLDTPFEDMLCAGI